MQTSTLALLGGTVAVVAVGAAVLLRPVPEAGGPADGAAAVQVAVTEEAVPQPDGTAPPEVTAPPEDMDAPEAEGAAAIEGAVDPVGADPVVPVLSDLRFEPDGGLVVSGRGAPVSPVSLRVDGREIDQQETGADGTFFFVALLGYSDAARVVTVVSLAEGGEVPADRSFVLAANPAPVLVVEAPAEVVVVADPETDTVTDPETDTVAEAAAPVATPDPAGSAALVAVVETAPEAATDAAPETTLGPTAAEPEPTPTPEGVTAQADPAPASPAILAVTGAGVEVVQPAISDTAPEVMATVALDTITYQPDGEVELGGRALGQGFVQVYVDNAPVSRLPVDADGTWRGDLPDVDTGVYTLRIDEVDAQGAVVSRIETPFLREDPETVAEVMEEQVNDPQFTVATRTVQPGATLWAIAEERYGAGVLYVTVFEANRDRIRNPDLIYPGQVFVLPEGGN